jgi:high-affinity iron transporter
VLPTFVIGLREGVEAALIVGIIAAFLVRGGRTGALRPMWIGVGAAVVLCLGFAVGLQVLDANLPQRQQEMLETVVALAAVGMVTYMVVFMRRHAWRLRGELESRADVALATGSTAALVAMAFFAVLREGLETSVFLLAAFQASVSPGLAAGGAIAGIVVAIALGLLIYRGGVRINLSRFFTATAVVLVVVAAGLLAFAAHSAHEAGWLNAWQAQALDLSPWVRPGSVWSALLTGVLGIQPRPNWAEVTIWLIYLVPMTVYVLWPRRRPVKPAVAPAT